MNRQLITTKDGSHTLYAPTVCENYHSIHGAIQESNHIFIKNGLNYFPKDKQSITILEVGFGTGLNTLLTYAQATKNNCKIVYHAIEPFPIPQETYKMLNYSNLIKEKLENSVFQTMHSCPWDAPFALHENFLLTKFERKIQYHTCENFYDLIYFDAFSPKVQSELWTTEIFQQMYASLKEGGILVTYCAKGEVKRSMKAAKFVLEALGGPLGKREITRAIKHNENL